ncbi:MAG: antibiotic biosynthesis monooxygenase family protein [Prevotellaceae bacterium]|nr:antibiotic biosynthesis monooxygenase family protein [Prevotellaceae bacterium]
MKSVFAIFFVLISLCMSTAAYGFEEKDMLNNNEKKGETVMETMASDNEMLVRISEIEVFPEFINEYLDFARNVGETSVREEPGVIAIFPMIQKRDSCQIRIVEIYRDNAAYKHHITTNHFQKYKQGTLKMVKTLDLVDMFPMNADAMPAIFRKME